MTALAAPGGFAWKAWGADPDLLHGAARTAVIRKQARQLAERHAGLVLLIASDIADLTAGLSVFDELALELGDPFTEVPA